MTLVDVFKLAALTGEFPAVKISKPLKHFPSTVGKIVQIRPDGVAVDFGGHWNKWFYSAKRSDSRSNYMDELTPVIKEYNPQEIISCVINDLNNFLARDKDVILNSLIRSCRECGCTDMDCRQCIEKTGGPCWWVGEDLCSACVK